MEIPSEINSSFILPAIYKDNQPITFIKQSTMKSRKDSNNNQDGE
jgi:hypothetical protein